MKKQRQGGAERRRAPVADLGPADVVVLPDRDPAAGPFTGGQPDGRAPVADRAPADRSRVDGAAALASEGDVVRKSQGWYGVRAGDRVVPCAISSTLRKQLVYPIADPGSLRHRVVAVEDIRMVDPIAVGDRVRFRESGDGGGLIVEVLPRRGALVRKAAGGKPLEQVIVANVDQVVVLTAAAAPPPSWELVDRYLAAAEAAGLPARVVVTKLDLVDAAELADEAAAYRALGYPVHLTSAVGGEGVAELGAALRGRLSVLAGKSGVGKSTILNAVQPGLGLRVGAVSELTGKGRHTTTTLELFPLDGGGGVVDTPGMREFGLWDVDPAEVALLFREIRPHVGACRFGLSCRHRAEPGCAVRAAVDAGGITPRRYRSYLRMAT